MKKVLNKEQAEWNDALREALTRLGRDVDMESAKAFFRAGRTLSKLRELMDVLARQLICAAFDETGIGAAVHPLESEVGRQIRRRHSEHVDSLHARWKSYMAESDTARNGNWR
jgi:hypothetical protein